METSERDYLATLGTLLTRRGALRAGALGGAGLAAAAIIGCGDEDEEKPEQRGAQAPAGPAVKAEYAANAKLVEEYKQRLIEDGAHPDFPYTYAEPNKTPKAGGILVKAEATLSKPRTHDPAQVGNSGRSDLMLRTNRLIGLVGGPNMNKYVIELQPELAKTWEVSPDGLTHTYRLQPGVKFHNLPPVNGRVLVAQDVKLNFERYAKSGLNTALFESVDTVTTVDDQTVRIRFKLPDPDFTFVLAGDALPILAPELFEGDLLTNTLIGTGPTLLERFDANITAVYKSNPDYWAGKPLLDGHEVRNIPDPAARVAAFRAGQIQGSGPTLAPTVQEAKAIKASVPDALMTQAPILNCSPSYLFNSAHPKFRDIRVRRAFSLAFDRKRWADIVHQGYGRTYPGLPWRFIFERAPGAAELGRWWGYDPAEAKQLLAAAGVEQLAVQTGTHSITQTVNSPDAVNASAADFLRAVGITFTIKEQQDSSLTQSRKWITDGAEMQSGSIVSVAPTVNAFYYAMVHSKSPRNFTGIDDAQLDEWAEKQRSELNPQARRDLLRKIWDRSQDQVYRVEWVNPFRIATFAGSVRFWRFNGPLITNYHGDFGRNFEKGWLDA